MITLEEKVICVTCPKGCTLLVDRDGQTVVKVEGGCKRGHEYIGTDRQRAESVDRFVLPEALGQLGPAVVPDGRAVPGGRPGLVLRESPPRRV